MWFPSCSSFSEFAPRPAALPGTADNCKAKSLRADRSWQDPQDSPIISHINFREWARWVRRYIVELLIDLPFTQKPCVFSVMQLYIIVYRITYMYYIITIYNYAYTLSIHITWYHMYIMCICVGSWFICCFFMQSCLPFTACRSTCLDWARSSFWLHSTATGTCRIRVILKRPEKGWKQMSIRNNVCIY